jgi:hypothetical protein
MLEFLIYFSYDPGTPSGFLSSSRQMWGHHFSLCHGLLVERL